jgi:NAD(P)-dependent dehydrogenase (short-subunit alcohol dehydrogenase family)
VGLLQGRVAIVTGAGRGIGAGIARRLAGEGAAVVVNDLGVALDGTGRDAAPGNDVADEISGLGGRAVASPADITDHAAAEGLVRLALEKFGRLDVVVNCAGILRDRMVFNMDEADWDAVVRVHLRGTFNLIKHAAAHWRAKAQPDGHFRIINFTSPSGLFGSPGQPNYAAAKMGVVGLTYSCASALGKYGVTTNAISPVALTRMTASIPTERRRGPSDDARAPENVAPIVVYVASERSDWLNGQVIGAGGYEVSLYNRPQVLARVASEGAWDLDRLADSVEESFRPVLESAVTRTSMA